MRAAFGRAETIRVDGREMSILLVKNPAGANEVLRTLALEPGEHDLLAVLNDDDRRRARRQLGLGRRLRGLVGPPAPRDVQRHARRGDGAAAEVRGRARGADRRSQEDLATALDLAIAGSDGRLFALPTYTAMLALREVLVDRGAAESSFA